LSTLALVLDEELQALFLLSSCQTIGKLLWLLLGTQLQTSKDCLFNKKASRKEMSADINQALVTEGRG